MLLRWSAAFWLLASMRLTMAEEVELTQDVSNRLKCEGMYSRQAWGGSVDPYILLKVTSYEPSGDDDETNPVIAAAIFNWEDQDLLGAAGPDGSNPKIVCDQEAIDLGYCTQENFGEYLVAPNATSIQTAAIYSKETKRKVINFPIRQTGYFCVITEPVGNYDYRAIVEFRNAYGELPGSQVPKLAFFGGSAILYALIGIFWGFLYFLNRSDILPVQNYITATLGFLVIEMIMTWTYFDYRNRNGANIGAKALMLIVSILNAARNSLSFFLLLIVCMGYGVVKPTLGKTMVYVRLLAATHFVFGVIYAVGSLTVRPEDAGPLVLLVVLPLAATGTAFYVWTLNALGATLKDLLERKQKVKALMYRKLWWCILTSVLVIFAFFFLNVLFFSGRDSSTFAPLHWKSRWFVLDGWLSLVYLADVAFIAYIWRPTANNRRFAMSDEINQDDEGFEIASMRDSLDELDEEEAADGFENGGWGKQGPPMARTGTNGSAGHEGSPLPAPRPQRPPGQLGRGNGSLDGETIFAVGEDGDRDSEEEEGDDHERQGLTRKDD